jgi:endonuclease VIII
VPEGDTIFRSAATLCRWLQGREITAARSTAIGGAAAALVGDRVDDVVTRAKHLLIRFDSGRTLHTHMRMTGSWHVYSAGERWQRPSSRARVVLEAGDHLAVCFDAPVVELLAARMEQVHPVLIGLGPDVLADPLDIPEVLRRVGTRPGTTGIGDLLLDQRVVSGIGNIYRCEALFLAGVDPSCPASRLSPAAVAAMVESAARLMRANLGPDSVGPRPGGRWVYGRAGRPCRRCGTMVRAARIGTPARTAYWCPRCQA